MRLTAGYFILFQSISLSVKIHFMNLEAIIGLEIHAQISTKTKMFCGCDNDAFGKEPNSCICPVCTGQPGTLPVPNSSAIEKGAKAALALGCRILPHSKFDRKNYFYPDLPAGYQISQFDEPISEHGAIEIEVRDPSTGESKLKKKIGITRLHLENDAGKLTHVGNSSLVDFNRAGTPLMEIVSKPDIRSPAEARAYAEAVQAIVQYAGSSHADMFKGEMRFDASVSLRPVGEERLYPRAEIKNLNSFKALESAIAYEIKRQTKLWEAGTPPASEQTVGWNDEKGETYLMREKESAADYRYFPEPDIPPLEFTPEQIAAWKSELPELPLARRARFVQDYQLTEQDAATLTADKVLADYFEEVAEKSGQPKKAANWVLTEVLGRMKNKLLAEDGNEMAFEDGEGILLEDSIDSVLDLKFTASQLAALIKMIEDGAISGKQAKEILDFMFVGEDGGDPAAIAKAKGMEQVSDSSAIEKFVDEVIAANESVVADFKSGKGNALGFLVGQVMKASGGQANPKLVNELLAKKLN
jgi:aspartyl-tRNA(Asn)/glutamyl-tRNA(Gln) amidotransferase subunit B